MKRMFKLTLTTTLLFVISVNGCATGNHTVPKKDVSPLNIGDVFIPAGYMGCPEGIDVNANFTGNPYSGANCYRIAFQRNCAAGWAGVYWTNRTYGNGANWGEDKGDDLSSAGYTKVTFWARGEKGGETVEFGSGGINTSDLPNKDSYNKTYATEAKGGRTVTLTKEWKQYTIDLTGKNLSSVIGGFFWSANWSANPGLIFYLDDILFE